MNTCQASWKVYFMWGADASFLTQVNSILSTNLKYLFPLDFYKYFLVGQSYGLLSKHSCKNNGWLTVPVYIIIYFR